MKTISLVQGSPEWHEHRATARNASEASIIMGASKKTSRAELLRLKASGNEKEYSAWVESVLFARGHNIEKAIRPFIEEIYFDDELFPITGTTDDGYLSASFDGHCSLGSEESWECKQWNKHKADAIFGAEIPAEDYWQVVHQSVVNDGRRVLYSVSDGTPEGTVSLWYELQESDKAKLIAGWKQFDEDLKNYTHTETKAEPTGKAPESLPALNIEVKGMVTASNIDAFKSHALAVFGAINKDLQTDGDFADAEKTVKWCKEVEDKLEAAKQHALSQTADIDALFRAIDDISTEARRVRLDLDKLVKTRKENIRIEIMREAETAFAAHVSTINARLGKVQLPAVKTDFAGVMKGKKTVQSLRDALDGELARAKIEASQLSELIGANLTTLRDMAVGFEFLFMDAQTICQKQNDDLVLLIKSRIADHKAAEQARIDAEVAKQLEAENAKEILAQQKAAADYATHTVDQIPMPDVRPAEKCYLNVDKDKKPTRPSDEQIILTISAAYEVDYSTAESWIMEMQSRMVAA